jgi:epimerase transport system membrane fusion protein
MNATLQPETQALLNATFLDDRKFRRFGLLIVLLVFGGFGTWSALASLSSAALAPGVITVESYRKTVQHLEGGIVQSIQVRDGDVVTKGQVLVTLEGTQSSAQLEVLRGQYFVAISREARLRAERDGLARVRYPDALLAKTHDQRTGEAMQAEDQAFEARKRAREGEIGLYRQQLEQLVNKAQGVRAQEQAKSQLVSSYRGELEDYRKLYREGFAQKQKLREIERELSQSEGEHAELKSTIAATDVQVSETQLKIVQLKKEFQRDVAKELSEVQAELFEIRERMGSLNDTVDRTVVKAPESGMVLGLAVHTIGAVIPPGGKLLEIVPQGEKLVVEANVSPIDIDRVKVGQKAEIRFNAFSARTTPKVEGTLVALSPDRVTDEQSNSAYYLARVQITSDGTNQLLNHKLELLPGMPAEVLINTGQRTLLQYLFSQVSDTLARSFIED